MKVLEIEFNDKGKKLVNEYLDSNKKNKRNFFKTFIGSFLVTTMLLASTTALKADVFSAFFAQAGKVVPWHRTAGAAAGAAITKKHDSDIQKALKTAGGVLAAEIIIKTVQGKRVDMGNTAKDAAFAAGGVALSKRKHSKGSRAAYAAGAVVAGEIATKAIEINMGNRRPANPTAYNRARTAYIPQSSSPGSTYCHKVTERIYENGRLTKEITKEVCDSKAHIQGYDGDQRIKSSFRQKRPTTDSSLGF